MRFASRLLLAAFRYRADRTFKIDHLIQLPGDTTPESFPSCCSSTSSSCSSVSARWCLLRARDALQQYKHHIVSLHITSISKPVATTVRTDQARAGSCCSLRREQDRWIVSDRTVALVVDLSQCPRHHHQKRRLLSGRSQTIGSASSRSRFSRTGAAEGPATPALGALFSLPRASLGPSGSRSSDFVICITTYANTSTQSAITLPSASTR